ncbi:MAG: hypothetical protein A2W91_09145 [Bacteroidetes bacterium GWF2_38_335]|nr:MAG: hypothetical protein A2W91_09145 [Bacteroidetes bacterium GWF2_38_335]OFY80537.1 MAG: hypothetical protein A2281_08870 [Bacteroidetes bacterium RIFOXYA12_FULL_38_20]HBS85852.1 hypothetical protein [Bacteroidales bacterium]
MRTFIILLFLIPGICGYSYSQKSDKTPEQKAENTSKTMGEKLGLTKDQISKVYTACLTKHKAIEAAKEKYADDEETKKLKEKEAKKAYDTALKGILTPEQYKKWKDYQDSQKKKKK